MAVTPVAMVEATLTTTLSTTLYTVPGSTKSTVTSITACNTSGATVNVTLKLGTKTFWSAMPITAGQTITVGPTEIRKVLSAAATITGGASSGSAIDLTVSGVEVS